MNKKEIKKPLLDWLNKEFILSDKQKSDIDKFTDDMITQIGEDYIRAVKPGKITFTTWAKVEDVIEVRNAIDKAIEVLS